MRSTVVGDYSMALAKWRLSCQVHHNGDYIMTRTDDDLEQFLVTVETKVKDYDIECRFFGPIPDCEI
jgi:hypothetical protein